jgi:hypothetical protein
MPHPRGVGAALKGDGSNMSAVGESLLDEDAGTDKRMGSGEGTGTTEALRGGAGEAKGEAATRGEEVGARLERLGASCEREGVTGSDFRRPTAHKE